MQLLINNPQFRLQSSFLSSKVYLRNLWKRLRGELEPLRCGHSRRGHEVAMPQTRAILAAGLSDWTAHDDPRCPRPASSTCVTVVWFAPSRSVSRTRKTYDFTTAREAGGIGPPPRQTTAADETHQSSILP